MKKLKAIVSFEKGKSAKFVLYGEGFDDGNRVDLCSDVDVGEIVWAVDGETRAQKQGTRLKFSATPVHHQKKDSKAGVTNGDVLGDLNVTVTFADGTTSEALSISNVAFLEP